MADWQENFSSPDLGEEETVLAIRLAEALRTDEVETFLEIYDSIPATTETKRVSILISLLYEQSVFVAEILRAIRKVKIMQIRSFFFCFAFVY
jgi:hypothetical protein